MSLVDTTADLKGTMFINLKVTTDSFQSRSVLIFLAILLNAFASALEVRSPNEKNTMLTVTDLTAL